MQHTRSRNRCTPFFPIAVQFETYDWPTGTELTPQCPELGPMLHFAKIPGERRHKHVILYPEHPFESWVRCPPLSV